MHTIIDCDGRDAMMSDAEIYRTAIVLIQHHGQGAPARATAIACELLVSLDVDGCTEWVRVAAAAEVLLAPKPPPGTRLN